MVGGKVIMEDSKVRSFVKMMLDSIMIILAFIIPLFLKYEFDWRVHFRQIFALLYLGIFLMGYFLLHFQNRSWRYFNYRDSIEIVVLNVVTNILFLYLQSCLNLKLPRQHYRLLLFFHLFFKHG